MQEVKLQVRCGDKKGEIFNTSIGTPQGDCASALLFTFYLAKSLQDHRSQAEIEHCYAKPSKRIFPNIYMITHTSKTLLTT